METDFLALATNISLQRVSQTQLRKKHNPLLSISSISLSLSTFCPKELLTRTDLWCYQEAQNLLPILLF